MTTSYNNLAPSLERLRLVKEAVHAVERQKGKSRLLISEEDEAALKCTLRAHAFQPKDPHGASTATPTAVPPLSLPAVLSPASTSAVTRAPHGLPPASCSHSTSGSSLGKPRGTSENQLRSEHRARKNTCPRCAPEVELFSSVQYHPWFFPTPTVTFTRNGVRAKTTPALHFRASSGEHINIFNVPICLLMT